MRQFTFIAYLCSRDKEYIKDVLDDSQYRFGEDNRGYCAISVGKAKINFNMQEEMESELISLGLGVDSSNIWWS